jgi:protein-S-isoprenylcysteine O-methyltransferase Ste14
MHISLTKLVAQIAGMALVFGLALFLAAGSIAWPAGWVFLGLFFVFVVAITGWLYRHDPALLHERMTGFTSDQQTWDQLFFVLMQIGFLAWLVLMPLDAVRFHWSRVSAGLQVFGALLLLASFYLFFLVYRENTFLSPLVRVQAERGQTVISTGPYRYVRHPMYAAALLLMLGTPLLLGSWYGVLGGLLLMLGIARRAVLEERTLRAGLPGYTEYMQRVRYRLVPYVW